MRIKTGVLAVTVIALLALSPASSQAASVDFGLKSTAAFPGQPVKFAYRTKNVSRRLAISVQRTFGTAARFRTIRRLKPTRGKFRAVTVRAPAAMGRYRYRIIIRTRGGRVKARSQKRLLTVFDVVPLSRLTGDSTSRTVQIGSTLFRYVWSYDSLSLSETRILKMDQTSCRGLVLDVAARYRTQTFDSWLRILQESGDPQTVSFSSNQVARVSFSLTGDAFELGMGTYGNDYDTNGYVNGFGLCYTPNGRPPRR